MRPPPRQPRHGRGRRSGAAPACGPFLMSFFIPSSFSDVPTPLRPHPPTRTPRRTASPHPLGHRAAAFAPQSDPRAPARSRAGPPGPETVGAGRRGGGAGETERLDRTLAPVGRRRGRRRAHGGRADARVGRVSRSRPGVGLGLLAVRGRGGVSGVAPPRGPAPGRTGRRAGRPGGRVRAGGGPSGRGQRLLAAVRRAAGKYPSASGARRNPRE